MRGKPPQDIKARRQGKPKLPQQVPLGTFGTTVRQAFGLILGALTIVGVGLYAKPKVSVSSSGSLRKGDPMGTVFSLANDGNFSIYNVTFYCRVEKFWGMEGVGFGPGTTSSDELEAGHTLKVPCNNSVVVGNPEILLKNISSVRVTLMATYRPSWEFWNKTSSFPYVADKNNSGEWVWSEAAR